MDLHRLLALLGLASLGVHGTALLLDKTVHMPVVGLFVPGASPYRPVSVALGVVAAEVMALVVVSFSVRKLIGQKRWRLLHWSTYGIFALATAHGLLAGSDSAQPWARDLYLGAFAAVAFATAWRASYRPNRRSAARVG
jgi:sulfoxide reductase heme-binding subunit YedZ